jgi:hypothetical protein
MQLQASDVGRALERLFRCARIPVLGLGCDVPARLVPDERRTGGKSRARIHDTGQGLVFHDRELGGVLRLRVRLGDHGNDRLAGIAGLVLGERGARRCRHRRAVGALEERRKGDVTHAVGAQIGHRPGSDDARTGSRPGQVDRGNAGVGVSRAQQDEPRLVGKRAVVAEEALAEKKALVLEALLRARRAEAGGGGVELDLHK